MHFYWKCVLKILDGCFANKQLLGVFVASLVFWGGTVSLGKHCPLRLWLEAEVLTHPEWFIQGAHMVRSEVRVPLGNVFLTFEGRAIFASSALLSLHSWVEVAPLGSSVSSWNIGAFAQCLWGAQGSASWAHPTLTSSLKECTRSPLYWWDKLKLSTWWGAEMGIECRSVWLQSPWKAPSHCDRWPVIHGIQEVLQSHHLLVWGDEQKFY